MPSSTRLARASARRLRRAVPALVTLLALAPAAGCGDSSDASDGGSGGGSGGGLVTEADCAVDEAGLDLEVADDLGAHPEAGAVFGDGEHHLEFVDEGYDAEVAPTYSYDLSYVVDGTAFPLGGGILENDGGDVRTVDSVFTSEADGRPGIFTLQRTGEVSFDGDSYSGDVDVLGRFCVTLAVDAS
ncbi:MAG TPA: hypothetical protein VGE77_11915 [Nocardioides sp.]